MTDYAKEQSTCSKNTGSYEPAQLATCMEIHPFIDGMFEQFWSLHTADFTVRYFTEFNSQIISVIERPSCSRG